MNSIQIKIRNYLLKALSIITSQKRVDTKMSTLHIIPIVIIILYIIKSISSNIYRQDYFYGIENFVAKNNKKNISKKYDVKTEIIEEISYLKSFLKSKPNINKTISESFDASLNYLNNLHDIELDWTSALPISSPPFSIREAGANSFLFDDLNHYSPSNGHPQLRKAIIEKFKKDGINASDKNIIVNTSVFEILDTLYSSFNWTNNDCILIPTPNFGYYASQAINHGINVKLIATSKEAKWKIDALHLDNVLTKTKAKIFIFTNPVNPTGVIYTKEEIIKLANVLKKHRVLTVSDEVFKDIVLNNSQVPFSIGSLNSMQNLTVTLNGVGKSMGLAGLRVSYAYIPDWLVDNIRKPLCGLSKPAERAAIQALLENKENNQYLEKTSQLYNKRIDIIKANLKVIDLELNKKFNTQLRYQSFVKIYLQPNSTNVLLIQFQGLKGKFYGNKQINSSLDLANYLSKKAKVAFVPGEAFFIEGQEMVLRIPLAAKNLKEGLQRVKLSLLNLKS